MKGDLIGTPAVAVSSIVNNNEAIVFGLGDIRKEAVVNENDEIVVRNVIRINTNINHTLINGMDSVRLAVRLKEIIDNVGQYLD